MSFAWTPEITQRLIELNGSGVSRQEIARKLGTTLDGVHGKLYRLQRNATGSNTSTWGASNVPDANGRGSQAVTFAEVAKHPDRCRWFIDESPTSPVSKESLVCGAPTLPGSRYCKEHHSRVFVKMPGVKKAVKQGKSRITSK